MAVHYCGTPGCILLQFHPGTCVIAVLPRESAKAPTRYEPADWAHPNSSKVVRRKQQVPANPASRKPQRTQRDEPELYKKRYVTTSHGSRGYRNDRLKAWSKARADFLEKARAANNDEEEEDMVDDEEEEDMVDDEKDEVASVPPPLLLPVQHVQNTPVAAAPPPAPPPLPPAVLPPPPPPPAAPPPAPQAALPTEVDADPFEHLHLTDEQLGAINARLADMHRPSRMEPRKWRHLQAAGICLHMSRSWHGPVARFDKMCQDLRLYQPKDRVQWLGGRHQYYVRLDVMMKGELAGGLLLRFVRGRVAPFSVARSAGLIAGRTTSIWKVVCSSVTSSLR